MKKKSQRGLHGWNRLPSHLRGDRTKGIMVTGIDPEKENSVSHLSNKIISGKYLTHNDKGIILGEGLAAYLKLKVNDTVVLIGQGYQGNMASGKYMPYQGHSKASASPEMNKGMALACRCRLRGISLSTGRQVYLHIDAY